MDATTAPTWDALKAELDALRAKLPAMRAEYPEEGELLEAFAGEAEPIESRAAHDDELSHHVWVELNHMLVDVGVLPEEQRQT